MSRGIGGPYEQVQNAHYVFNSFGKGQKYFTSKSWIQISDVLFHLVLFFLWLLFAKVVVFSYATSLKNFFLSSYKSEVSAHVPSTV